MSNPYRVDVEEVKAEKANRIARLLIRRSSDVLPPGAPALIRDAAALGFEAGVRYAKESSRG